ncbi:MAG: DNA replication/repair protein RecF [Geobacter sp.]
MLLTGIRLDQYRNLAAAELRPSNQITLLHGLNGQGKTNLLEAIYLLGTGRSFRNVKTPDLIRQGMDTAVVTGQVLTGGVASEIKVQLAGKQRRVTVDGKPVQRAAELHGKLAAVVFSPDDTAMVKQGPETRRRYLDRALYTGKATFLRDYHEYYRTLKQRNALLRCGTTDGLDVWSEQLVTSGTRLMEHRRQYVAQLLPLVQQHYQRLAGSRETVELAYAPDSDHRFQEQLEQCRVTDLRRGTTGRGPHRDDLAFMIDGHDLKTFGSQGQQRSFVLALKLAELDHLQQTFGEPPLMLLDDIASELDRERIHNLLDFLRQRQVQVVITTTTTVGIDPGMLQQSSLYRVDAGTLTYEGSVPR